MQSADAATPEPTYATSASSRSPWTVPSSPNGPCRTGKTTSTWPSGDGGAPFAGIGSAPAPSPSSARDPSVSCQRPSRSICHSSTS